MKELDVDKMKRLYEFGGLFAYKVVYYDPHTLKVEEAMHTFNEAKANEKLLSLTAGGYACGIKQECIKFDEAFALEVCESPVAQGDVEALAMVPGVSFTGEIENPAAARWTFTRDALHEFARRLTPPRSDAPAGGGVEMPEPVARRHAASYTNLLWLYPAPYEYPPDGCGLFTEMQLRAYGDARESAALARLVPVAWRVTYKHKTDSLTLYKGEAEVLARVHGGTTDQLYTLTPSNGAEESGDA